MRYEVKMKVHGRWNVAGEIRDTKPDDVFMTNEKTANEMVAAGEADIVKVHEEPTPVPFENQAIEPGYQSRIPGRVATSDHEPLADANAASQDKALTGGQAGLTTDDSSSAERELNKQQAENVDSEKVNDDPNLGKVPVNVDTKQVPDRPVAENAIAKDHANDGTVNNQATADANAQNTMDKQSLPADGKTEDQADTHNNGQDDDHASKAAEELAKEHKIDLDKVKGTGKNGNITKADVQKAIDAKKK